jgi:hypothetical protein
LKDIKPDVSYGLVSFFKQGFWKSTSPQKRQEWIQMMQYILPHLRHHSFKGDEFTPKEGLPLHDLSVIRENITPTISDGVPVHKQLVIFAKSIVGSEQAKEKGFVDFVPVLGSSSQFRISSNLSKLYYATIDSSDPSSWSIYWPDDTTSHEIKPTQVLIAHHNNDALMKLLLNYASYERRGILTFVLLNEHFLVYNFWQLDLCD